MPGRGGGSLRRATTGIVIGRSTGAVRYCKNAMKLGGGAGFRGGVPFWPGPATARAAPYGHGNLRWVPANSQPGEAAAGVSDFQESGAATLSPTRGRVRRAPGIAETVSAGPGSASRDRQVCSDACTVLPAH
jgi:hypothetical protein